MIFVSLVDSGKAIGASSAASAFRKRQTRGLFEPQLPFPDRRHQ